MPVLNVTVGEPAPWQNGYNPSPPETRRDGSKGSMWKLVDVQRTIWFIPEGLATIPQIGGTYELSYTDKQYSPTQPVQHFVSSLTPVLQPQQGYAPPQQQQMPPYRPPQQQQMPLQQPRPGNSGYPPVVQQARQVPQVPQVPQQQQSAVQYGYQMHPVNARYTFMTDMLASAVHGKGLDELMDRNKMRAAAREVANLWMTERSLGRQQTAMEQQLDDYIPEPGEAVGSVDDPPFDP